MKIAFDLISDLNIINDFNWEGQPTSLNCVVAGNVSKDFDTTIKALEHLGEQYKSVFYIDGYLEHQNSLAYLDESYKEFKTVISRMDNVVYMQDNVVIQENLAIVAANGWWTYDFNFDVEPGEAEELLKSEWVINDTEIATIYSMAYGDARYLTSCIQKLQTYKNVEKIIVITNTVPYSGLLAHDKPLFESVRLNLMGNSLITQCLAADEKELIDTWCFGHYPEPLEEFNSGIRFVSNPKAEHAVYNPKRIEIDC
jgi:hypothetical protein